MKNEKYQIEIKGISGIIHKLEGYLYKNSFIVKVENLLQFFSVCAFLVDVEKIKLEEYLNRLGIEKILIKISYQNEFFKQYKIVKEYKNILEKSELKDIIGICIE